MGPPQNFVITVEGTETLSFSWELPLEIELGDIDFFVIDCEPTFQHDITVMVMGGFSVTLEEFLPGTTYTCTVRAGNLGAPAVQTATTEEGMPNVTILIIIATLYCFCISHIAPSYLPYLVLGATEGVDMITLPASDDANSDPIYITGGLPLGSRTQTIAFVSHC